MDSKTEKSLIDLLSNCSLNDFSKFISLDNVAKEFSVQNKLLEPMLITETSRGKILTWRDISKIYQVILYSEIKNDGRLQPYIGGNGNSMYSSIEKSYIMEGQIYGEKIRLETEITLTQNFNMVQPEGMCRCVAKKPVANGEPELRQYRKDRHNFWFILPPNK